MRKVALALIAMVAASMSVTASHAYTCQSRTKAGSCKDTTGEIHCGAGSLTDGAPVDVFLNQDAANGKGELEACSDQGSGNQRGRAVVQGDKDHGVRVVLDTDKGQPFPPGWIILQVSQDHPGLWCNKKGSEDPAHSDGYARSWSSPGTDGGADANAANCVPTLPIPGQ